MKPLENINSLKKLISTCMEMEYEYETLKFKTVNPNMFKWAESRQESMTDFIMSLLSLYKELGGNIEPKMNIVPLSTSSGVQFLIKLDDDLFTRKCKKMDEANWHIIIKEMTEHGKNSKIYKLLNRRLEKINNHIIFDESPNLLVG